MPRGRTKKKVNEPNINWTKTFPEILVIEKRKWKI